MVKHTQTIHWLLLTNCLSVFHYLVGLMLEELAYARDICNLHFWSMIPIPTYLDKSITAHTLWFKKKIVYKTLFFREFMPS